MASANGAQAPSEVVGTEPVTFVAALERLGPMITFPAGVIVIGEQHPHAPSRVKIIGKVAK